MSNLSVYKSQLLDNGFSEAKECKDYFYKELMPYTAFVVNLTSSKGICEIVYGCASTAFTKLGGNSNVLIETGVCSEDITIRKHAFIKEGEDNDLLYSTVQEMYLHFLTVDKDSLMAEAKELRKAFITKFAMPLKVLGLKKKGNVWTISNGGHIFEIEKSLMFGDKYYFNLNGYRIQIPEYPEPVDWQLIDEDSLEEFIHSVVRKIQNMTIY